MERNQLEYFAVLHVKIFFTMAPSLSALALLLFGLFTSPCQAEVVTVYTSANFAPLVINDKQGLYPDLIAYLNRQNLDGLTFELAYLPRKRLQVKLEEGSIDGIIIGMMPQWFGDAAQTKYLWTRPFASDNFILVSSSDKALNAQAPATLAGATVGLTLGYVYPGIDEWIAANGLVRNDGVSEEKNVEKLLLRRVDCIVVSQTVIKYFIRINGLQGRFRFGQVPGQVTERRFLIPHAYRRVYDKLAPAIKRLEGDPVWQHIAEKY
ncbi:MAG: transporter substrate-binding domain-containing protein [Pseudomonadota bacterium]